MGVRVLHKDVVIPDIRLEDGVLPLHPAAFYDPIPHEGLLLWCHHHARYGLPTAELVSWLQEQIGGRPSIEIGSGSGDLAFHLGIPATDNHMQEWPDVAAYYAVTGQPTISYGEFVEKLDAMEALGKYKPEVVLASWVTQWIDPSLPPPPQGGNMYGVHEDKIVEACDYILIGNEAVHGRKPTMRHPHEEHALPFLRSRSHVPALDRVWIWRKRRVTALDPN